MPKIAISTLTPTIGAVIKGIDLARVADDETIAAIRAALLKHKVIFFEDQHITPVQHRDFAARFGTLHTHPLYPGVPDAPEMFILDNHAGNPTDNDAWHTDVTFIETPPLGAVLYAKLLPEEGGDTCWANMQAAYEALSKPMKRFTSQRFAATAEFPIPRNGSSMVSIRVIPCSLMHHSASCTGNVAGCGRSFARR